MHLAVLLNVDGLGLAWGVGGQTLVPCMKGKDKEEPILNEKLRPHHSHFVVQF